MDVLQRHLPLKRAGLDLVSTCRACSMRASSSALKHAHGRSIEAWR